MALDDVPRLCGGQKISDHRDISGLMNVNVLPGAARAGSGVG